jgi:hypothetical protein
VWLPADDHANNAAGASVMRLPFASGEIDHQGDHDWFQFQVRAGLRYLISVSGGQWLPMQARLLEADGGTVVRVNNGVADWVSYFDYWTAPADGTYFLQVRAAPEYYGGEYQISIFEVPEQA